MRAPEQGPDLPERAGRARRQLAGGALSLSRQVGGGNAGDQPPGRGLVRVKDMPLPAALPVTSPTQPTLTLLTSKEINLD